MCKICAQHNPKKKKKMKAEMLIQLTKLADSLDQKGFYKEADFVDQVVQMEETPAQMFIGEILEAVSEIKNKKEDLQKTFKERFEQLPLEVREEVTKLLGGMSLSAAIDRWIETWLPTTIIPK